MSWKNIKLVFLREVRDQLRDRRTLFMIAVLPLLLYPGLGIGMMQMTVLFTEHTRTVVILGAKDLPAPPLVKDGRFDSRWFTLATDADRLQVVTDAASGDSQPLGDPDAVRPVSNDTLLYEAERIRAVLAKRDELFDQLVQARANDDQSTASKLDLEVRRIQTDLSELFTASGIQVLIIVPEGFGSNVERVNRDIAERQQVAVNAFDYPRPLVVRNSADEKSLIAYGRVKEALAAWERSILEQRLMDAGLPESLPTPVNAKPVDLAKTEQLSAGMWSKLFPALLIIMALTGAFYPAVDLAAGEKERGTMETLLISPATRSEIVMGKFLTVMLFSMTTASLHMISMGMTGRYMVSLAGAKAAVRFGSIAYPSLSAVIWMLVLLVPIAALFSALCLALATFARSTKEGQYYQTPLLMVTMGIAVLCISPAVEITPFYSVMPVMGAGLLLKALLLAPSNAGTLYWYAIPVLATSVVYSLLALWWAIEQFSRESVLFREAERFEPRLWLRHLLRDKEATPSFTEAGICFVIIMFLQFMALQFMQGAFAGVSKSAHDTLMIKLLVIQQLAIIASPALFMGILLTTSVQRTFRLRLPSAKMLIASAVLPLALHPLSLELAQRLAWFFPPLPDSIVDFMQTMKDDDQPLWLLLLAFAVAPAICEEVAYRGFILSGFSRSGRIGLAIVLSSVAFGAMHMIPQQVFNASLLGLVLGLIAVRSGSLLCCIVFHFLYNGIEVIRGRAAGSIPEWAGSFVRVEGDQVLYTWPTLAIAGVVAAFLLMWLLRSPARPARYDDSELMQTTARRYLPSSPLEESVASQASSKTW